LRHPEYPPILPLSFVGPRSQHMLARPCYIYFLILHWVLIIFFFFETAPQSHQLSVFNKPGFRRTVGLAYYGLLPTLDAAECDMRTCFNRSWCGSSEKDFSISLYPPEAGLAIRAIDDVPIIQSKWWINIKSGLTQSKYFVQDPWKACVIVPNFEHTLASNERGTYMVISKTLRSLKTWNRFGLPGSNHLVFNKHDDFGLEYDASYAMAAKVGWSAHHYRPAFDIALFPPLGRSGSFKDKSGKDVNWWKDPKQERDKRYFLTFIGKMEHHPIRQLLADSFDDPSNGVIIQEPGCKDCPQIDYVDSLLFTQFALCPRGLGLYTYRTVEAIMAGAIPVIIGDHYVYPFNEIIDWRSFSVILPDGSWNMTMEVLQSLTKEEINNLRHNMGLVYHRFLKDNAMIETTLDLLRMNIYGPKSGKLGFGEYKYSATHPYSLPFPAATQK